METADGALVTAILTTHNRSNLLPRAIDSMLRQTYGNIEVIVVDDGSRDETEKIVREYRNRHPNIRYLRNEKPAGACAARNLGISEARGKFVAGLDDDDEWLPRRVEVLLRNYSDKYAYICSQDLILENGRRTLRKGPDIINLEDMLFSNVTGNQILTTREKILDVGGFDVNLSAAQDYDLWLRLLEKYGPARRVQEVLQIVHRDHETKRVSIAKGKIKGEWFFYTKHKGKMNHPQRKVHILQLKRLKAKNIKLIEVIAIANTAYFRKFAVFYLKNNIKALQSTIKKRL